MVQCQRRLQRDAGGLTGGWRLMSVYCCEVMRHLCYHQEQMWHLRTKQAPLQVYAAIRLLNRAKGAEDEGCHF